MKRIYVILLLVLASAFCLAGQSKKQMGDVFSNMIIAKTQGVIVTEDLNEDQNVSVRIADLPDYYDLEIVVATINNLVDEYSDIKVYHAWFLNKDKEFELNLVIDAKKGDVAMIIRYEQVNNWLLVGFHYGDAKDFL